MILADCSMCPHETCTIAESCRRSRRSGTVPNEWQWWSDYGPQNTPDCSGWWPAPRWQMRPGVEETGDGR